MWKKVMKIKNINSYFLIISYVFSILIAFIVYYTGGTTKVYSNLMYIPIAIISSTNGKKIGVVHAILSALMIGPYMPLYVDLNQMQMPINWIIRLIIYTTISLIIGYFSDYDKHNKEYITNLLTHDIITDFKNIESLKNEPYNKDKWRTIVALSVKGYEETLHLFGYNFTNETILKLSIRLREELLKYDNIELYKCDGMEFIIIITHKEKEIDMEEILYSIEGINKSTIKVDNIPIYIETIMGISKIKGDESILEGLRQSLIALRHAIGNDMKLKTYDSCLDIYYKNIVDIAANFKTSLANNNIKAAYQNIHDSHSNEIYGVELLARWINDDGTQIYPNEFIPVIEKTELINELTKFMIDKAVTLILNNNNKELVVSINFSAKDFNDENVNYLIRKIQENELNPKQFEIEITEEVLLNKEESIKYLNIIRSNGIMIAMDDFGTGYSSYQYLSELPIDVVKIDKSLINKIGDNMVSRSLVKSVVYFCKYNKILTIAEGVETKEIADACKDIGIDILQGYYFHIPQLLSE